MPYKKRGSRTKANRTISAQSPGEDRDATILFVDVVGCSEISNHLTLKIYNDFIEMFKNTFNEVCEYYKNTFYDEHEHVLFNYEARGDEGCLKIFVGKKDDALARDIDVAISIALDLKRKWLLNKHNDDRIKEGLLPVDLAVGIHFGKVHVKNGNAEGYAINLAKRIESHSREGDFTHILISEAAHGKLDHLKDEKVYRFAPAFTINPKGISHTIRVFEIKHHYLPTDWQEIIEDNPIDVSMIFDKYSQDAIKTVELAYNSNPTNLWLAETYIFIKIVDSYLQLKEQKKEGDPTSIREAYAPVLNVVQRIANNVLVDETLYLIWGQIYGEIGNYTAEEKKYEYALKLSPIDGDVHWYLGLCISYQIKEAYEQSKKKIDIFYEEHRPRINIILNEYREAIDLNPMNPLIVWDYACELSWWSRADQGLKKDAIEKLLDALKLDSELKDWASQEEYLEPIINDPKVSKYLK